MRFGKTFTVVAVAAAAALAGTAGATTRSVPAGSCGSDQDCTAGQHCRAPGLDACCSGAYCDDEPMCGTCATIGSPCSADADCVQGESCPTADPAGTACCPVNGSCPADSTPCTCTLDPGNCFTDTDCPLGEVCQNMVNCGGAENCVGPYACAAPPTTCGIDQDCGNCAVCVGGTCEGLGDVTCTVDSDCASDEVCVVIADASCKNHCMSKACEAIDCAQTCDPYTEPCADGLTCVEPIKGCCGSCQAVDADGVQPDAAAEETWEFAEFSEDGAAPDLPGESGEPGALTGGETADRPDGVADASTGAEGNAPGADAMAGEGNGGPDSAATPAGGTSCSASATGAPGGALALAGFVIAALGVGRRRMARAARRS